MSVAAGIVVYILLWWWIFFMALSIGVKRNNNVELGHDTGAPTKAYLWTKVVATTLIALILWFGVNALITAELFSFREMSKSM